MRPQGVAVVAVGAALSALSLLPGAAMADNDNQACALVKDHVVKEVFGLKHVLTRKKVGGGTDDSIGSFTATCDVYAYNKKPTHSTSFGVPPHYRIRKGLGGLIVDTTVQTDDASADNWDPGAVNREILEGLDGPLSTYGGGQFDAPGLGFTDVHAFWIGNEANSTQAFWRDGDDGFIALRVVSHGSAKERLREFAHKIADHFVP